MAIRWLLFETKLGEWLLIFLERKAKLILPELAGRHVRYALCARSGFTEQLKQIAVDRVDIRLFDLTNILEA